MKCFPHKLGTELLFSLEKAQTSWSFSLKSITTTLLSGCGLNQPPGYHPLVNLPELGRLQGAIKRALSEALQKEHLAWVTNLLLPLYTGWGDASRAGEDIRGHLPRGYLVPF